MAGIGQFLVRKLVRLAILVFAVATIAFALVSISPIDPVRAYIGADMVMIGPAQRELIAQRWGLNDPPLTRYVHWLGQAITGNFGTSMVFNQPVLDVIATRFGASLALMGLAWVISGLLGFGLGVLAGTRENSLLDRGIRLYAYLMASSPTFWVGLLLLNLFSVALKWTPTCCSIPIGADSDTVGIFDRLHHLILPALTLSIISVANITLHTRQKLIDVLHSDYALFARAQGETDRGLVRHHGLRNIALPAITLQFASLSELFGGAVLTEQVFSYPGLGQATVQAGLRGDIPLLLGIVIFSAIFVFVGNTLADLSYQVIDPRIRLRRGRMAKEQAV